MVSKNDLKGDEVVKLDGLAIAYYSRVESPDGHYSVGVIGGPKFIQAADIPEELAHEMRKVVVAHEQKKWGLPGDTERTDQADATPT